MSGPVSRQDSATNPHPHPAAGTEPSPAHPPSDVVTLGQLLTDIDTEEKHLEKLIALDATKQCSYPQGYITQEVFACKTCYGQKYGIPPEQLNAKDWHAKCRPCGMCLACCVVCHQDHEMVELYRKRDFRCDCGNSKFGSGCTLHGDKDYENVRNKYGQNFFGLFCRCHEEYEPHEGECMFQCVVCLEWFHGKHLNPNITDAKAVEDKDLVCKECLNGTVDFLQSYISSPRWQESHVTPHRNPEEIKKAGDKRDRTEDARESITQATKRSKIETSSPRKSPVSASCKYKSMAKIQTSSAEDVLLCNDWRNELCDCEECREMYKKRGLDFLLAEEEGCEVHELLEYSDTKAVEEGKATTENAAAAAKEGVLDSLCRIEMETMPRDRQYQVTDGFRRLIEGFREQFKGYAEEGRVVTAEDIQKLFRKLNRRNGSP